MGAAPRVEEGDTRPLRQVLILGGAGFLGSWVTQQLEASGVATTVLGYGAHRPGDLGLAITRASVEEAIASEAYDLVVFLAGSPSVPRSIREPAQDLHDNAGMVVDVLEALRAQASSPVFLFVSSAAVYGTARNDSMDEDHPLVPRSPYGISKLAAEQYIRLYAETYGVRAFCVRPFSVYGPGQRKLVVYDLLVRLLAGENPLEVQSPPDVARDFVFVADFARAAIQLARTAPAVGEAYNICSGVATTLTDLTHELLEATGLRASVLFTGILRTGDPLRWRGDPSRAARFGVGCDTPLSAGLRETADWVRAELHHPAA